MPTAMQMKYPPATRGQDRSLGLSWILSVRRNDVAGTPLPRGSQSPRFRCLVRRGHGCRSTRSVYSVDHARISAERTSTSTARRARSDSWTDGSSGLPASASSASERTDIDGLATLYREANAVINLCGSHELRDEHDAIDCLVYLETDPVAKQIAVANGYKKTIAELERYKHLFTYAEILGADESRPVELSLGTSHVRRSSLTGGRARPIQATTQRSAP